MNKTKHISTHIHFDYDGMHDIDLGSLSINEIKDLCGLFESGMRYYFPHNYKDLPIFLEIDAIELSHDEEGGLCCEFVMQ